MNKAHCITLICFNDPSRLLLIMLKIALSIWDDERGIGRCQGWNQKRKIRGRTWVCTCSGRGTGTYVYEYMFADILLSWGSSPAFCRSLQQIGQCGSGKMRHCHNAATCVITAENNLNLQKSKKSVPKVVFRGRSLSIIPYVCTSVNK